MNILSHFCCQPHGSITDEEMVEIKDLVDKMDRLWRKLAKNVPPKVHTWHHLVQALDRFRGLKFHNESKIEVAHQVGKRTALRFRSLAGGLDRMMESTTQFQANINDPAMKARQIEVNEQRSRKLGGKTKEARAEKADATKRAKHDQRNSILALPEVSLTSPLLTERTTRGCLKRAAATVIVLQVSRHHCGVPRLGLIF